MLLTFTASALAAMAGAVLAALSMGLGLVVERWLFFAKAEHVAMLYYGADAA
jgi:sulfite dehydrogenase (quinone) subunit SoeC